MFREKLLKGILYQKKNWRDTPQIAGSLINNSVVIVTAVARLRANILSFSFFLSHSHIMHMEFDIGRDDSHVRNAQRRKNVISAMVVCAPWFIVRVTVGRNLCVMHSGNT